MGRKKEGDIIVGQIGGEGLLWRENMVGGPRAWHVPGAPQHGDLALALFRGISMLRSVRPSNRRDRMETAESLERSRYGSLSPDYK